MKKMRMKYFSFDKIAYLYDMIEDTTLPIVDETMLDSELKIAG